MSKKIEVYGHGSIPFITSISSGYAAAMGIELPVRITALIDNESRDIDFIIMGEWDRDTRLLESLRKTFLNRFVNRRVYGLKIQINSSIPPGIGLKSSASIAIYTIYAVTNLLGLQISENDMIYHALNITKGMGGYKSGALDGIYASLKGGIVYTDNMGSRVVSWYTNVPSCSVLIAYKQLYEYDVINISREIRRYGELFKKAFDVGQKGNHLTAATLHGVLYSLLTQLDYETLVSTLTNGAIAACIAGTGPALCIFVEDEDVDRFRRYLIDRGYKVIESRPTSTGSSFNMIEK